MTRPANFDRLAGVYRAMEFLAFGGDLERARFCLLDRLQDCRDILILGEGDGRCLERLTRAAPKARFHCVDASAAMLARAARRLDGTAAAERVRLERADALALDFPAGRYDAVVTLFFLDCFTAEQVAGLVARLAPVLRPGGLWLWADFALPDRGWRRLRARAWLALLYAFFRWETGIAARELPPAEALLRKAGFAPLEERAFQGGLIRAVLWRS